MYSFLCLAFFGNSKLRIPVLQLFHSYHLIGLRSNVKERKGSIIFWINLHFLVGLFLGCDHHKCFSHSIDFCLFVFLFLTTGFLFTSLFLSLLGVFGFVGFSFSWGPQSGKWSGGCSPVRVFRLLLRWHCPSQSTGSRPTGLSSHGTWAQQLRLSGSRAQSQHLCMGLVAPRYVGSSQTRDQTGVFCTISHILRYSATREAQQQGF